MGSEMKTLIELVAELEYENWLFSDDVEESILSNPELNFRRVVRANRADAKRMGITEEKLAQYKVRLKLAWEDSGGLEGAIYRDKWINDYLKKNK